MNANGQVQATPGVIYPDVTVAGKPYKLKFTLASQFLLQQWDIPVDSLADWIAGENAAGHTSNVVLKLAASMLGTIDARGDWEPLALDPLKLAAKLITGEWPAIMMAFTSAMEKAQPAADKDPAATPATPEPIQ